MVVSRSDLGHIVQRLSAEALAIGRGERRDTKRKSSLIKLSISLSIQERKMASSAGTVSLKRDCQEIPES